LSVVVADQVNQQLAQGLDLNGAFGATLFGDINAAELVGQRSIAHANNDSASGNFEVRITDSSQLSLYDYEVKFTSATEFRVMRSDGQEILPETPATAWTMAPTPPAFDGMTLEFKGTYEVGDRFTLIPTRHAAGDIDTIVTEPKR